jgi:hypothetical protein
LPPDGVPCDQATNPLGPTLTARSGRVLVFYNAAQRRPVGLGNELLGYVSVFYDAMRTGRALVLEDSGMICKLRAAFSLGTPFATADQLAAKPEHNQSSAYALHNSSHLFSNELPVVFSKGNNVKLVRPKRWAHECYRAALNCPPLPATDAAAHADAVATSPAKSAAETANSAAAVTVAASIVDEHETRPAYTCGERRALRRLVVGASPRLKALQPQLEQYWSGDKMRLRSLLAATADSQAPIWQVAVHARTQFGFVEAGVDEREPSAVQEVKNWTQDARVQAVLANLVQDVKRQLVKNTGNQSSAVGERYGGISSVSRSGDGRNRRQRRSLLNSEAPSDVHDENAARSRKGRGAAAVFVASESLLARQHIAALLRAAGVAADYHTLRGTSHPATTAKVEHRHPRGGNAPAANENGVVRADRWCRVAGAEGVVLRSGKPRIPGDDISSGAGREVIGVGSERTEKELCDMFIPFLEWWALAQSRRVVTRRGSELGVRRYPLWRFYERWGVRPSSFAESALLYGGWD